MAQPERDNAGQPMLLTSLGAPRVAYDTVTYTLNGQRCPTRYAPVATAVLNNLQGGKALVLVTPKAKEKSLRGFTQELPSTLGMDVQAIDIDTLIGPEETFALLEALEKATPKGASLYIDVTFALRHMPLTYMAAVGYLTALKDVQVNGIFYGAFEMKGTSGEVPLIDLTAMLRLTDWAHALRNASEHGDLGTLSGLVKGDVTWMFKSGNKNPALSPVRDSLDPLAQSLTNGLPLSVGKAAYSVQQGLRNLTGQQGLNIPTSTLAAATLHPLVDRLAIETPAEVVLCKQELSRQLALIETYLDWNNESTALLCLREWLVNFVLWHKQQSFPSLRWLLYGDRRNYGEIPLHVLTTRNNAKRLKCEPQITLAKLWDQITERRNCLAHAGFGDKPFKDGVKKTRTCVDQCRQLLDQDSFDLNLPTSIPHLLITPLGLSPGVLFTAVRKLNADMALIVTSARAAEAITEALSKAGRPKLPYETIPLDDPHGGFDQAQHLCGQWQELLASAANITVNITGGTTALQYIAERLGQEGADLGATLKQVALIDKRPFEQQKSQPYVEGELITLH